MAGVPPSYEPYWTLRAQQSREHRRTGAAPHRPVADPQLLHHRPHRPRQVDAGRPDAAADRVSSTTVPMRAQYLDRMDIERERGITIKSQAVRLPFTASDGRHLRPEHDRHPGARRLHLRGVALARRLRGHRAARRRRAGHRGADPGEPVPGARERPADHPGAQQDRPAVRPAREVRRRDRAHHRLRPGRRPAGQRQDRDRRPRPARRDRARRVRCRSATRTRRPAR